MQIMWCWRCKMDVPMLDDQEFAVIYPLYSECMRSVKDYRERNGTSLSETPIDDRSGRFARSTPG